MHRWLERRAERRDERERARQERGYVVAGVYAGNRTPGTRVQGMDFAPVASEPLMSRRDEPGNEAPDDHGG